MSTPTLTIAYPLFVLKTGERDFVACDLSLAEPRKRKGMAIPVFTSEERAVEYLRAAGGRATIRAYEREPVFRRFLSTFRDTEHRICFDPQALGGGRTRVGHVYRAAVVMERFTTDPGWGWQYPMYAVNCWGNYVTEVAHYSSPDGGQGEVPMKMVFLFTDSDLADREIMAYHTVRGGVAVPIEDPREFARFLRRLPPDVKGVIFDPPARRDWIGNTGMLRDSLIANLEAKV